MGKSCRLLLALVLLLLAAPALAAPCGGDFNAFLAAIGRDAQGQGVSRAVIDQAIGIVMAQQRGTPEQAFAALRTISQRRNVKLRVVAAELVDTISRSGPESSSF